MCLGEFWGRGFCSSQSFKYSNFMQHRYFAIPVAVLCRHQC